MWLCELYITNDNVYINIYRNEIAYRTPLQLKSKTITSFTTMNYTHYSPEELRLAHELAETLNDQESFTLFLSFTQKYHESFLRKTLARVMLVPDYKIRKTKGALFTDLVTRHGQLPESGARR